ncbi:hypothetical protein [Halorubrum tropicale]|uniref:Uncharacterized protein n=1 Tax=Halorubrum tropicale TaxID=1765655 RepID=A0A0M9AN44_9EURY|nr:hypothetical protein [Halorubrum tropicale]KOX94215.1 hypothetical protein AMR74_16005 [Halorubrum tropicale]
MPYGWTILEILGVAFGVLGIYYGITEAQFLTAGLGFYATSVTVAYHSADVDREDLFEALEEERADKSDPD